MRYATLIFLTIFSTSLAFSATHSYNQKAADKTKETDQEKKACENGKEEPNKKDETPKPEKLLKIGNLAFPPSQQPTPLVSFGQNLFSEGQVIWQGTLDEVEGKNFYFIEASNALIYSFKNNLSIFIYVPHAIRLREGKFHSSGIEDLLIQFEYAPYTKEQRTYYDQISIVVNVTIPTGSAKKHPPTGVGANSFFIGWTFSRMGINWFYFTSYGGILNASSHRTQFGNQFLYQYGIGRRIFNTSDWLFDWMLEMNGQYTAKNKINGVIDPNSGGNVMMITPSFFLSSKKSLVVQAGIGFPIVQQLFGHQKTSNYVFHSKISWTF